MSTGFYFAICSSPLLRVLYYMVILLSIQNTSLNPEPFLKPKGAKRREHSGPHCSSLPTLPHPCFSGSSHTQGS